ncbi:SGNH hydrolase [Lentinula aciculospora]|uniref:SGNH hydrolase n=1 Tax=Lentinula aciculospora TaxID=153920 RepID=A0A9W9ANF1_9AGAR|nr:SGNH hydrolase [Lentinula aciculospora]
MFSFTVGASLFLLSSVTAQTVYLAGDSTMAPNGDGAGTGTDGWGQYLGQYLTLSISNQAIAGRSARSFTEEGRFTTIIDDVVAGDFVIIEFGHNDGLSGDVDNGREDAFGDSLTTTTTVTETDGSTEVIHTFNYYMTNAVNSLKAKGAIPIVSAQTPDNIWDGDVIAAPPRFVPYAQEVSGNTSVTYVDHYDYVAQAYEVIGETTVNTYYPIDHTHTTITGANVVAEAFVRGLLCSPSTLKSFVNSAGEAVPNGCL